MRHTLLTILLTLGVVGGIAAGCRSLHMRRDHHASFEAHIAEICVQAAAKSHTKHSH